LKEIDLTLNQSHPRSECWFHRLSVEETLGLEPSGMAHVYAAMLLTGLPWKKS